MQKYIALTNLGYRCPETGKYTRFTKDAQYSESTYNTFVCQVTRDKFVCVGK